MKKYECVREFKVVDIEKEELGEEGYITIESGGEWILQKSNGYSDIRLVNEKENRYLEIDLECFKDYFEEIV